MVVVVVVVVVAVVVLHIFFGKLKVCDRICKFEHIFNKCGRVRVGFVSSTKGFLSLVRKDEQ